MTTMATSSRRPPALNAAVASSSRSAVASAVSPQQSNSTSGNISSPNCSPAALRASVISYTKP
jgi:hypothetical protein